MSAPTSSKEPDTDIAGGTQQSQFSQDTLDTVPTSPAPPGKASNAATPRSPARDDDEAGNHADNQDELDGPQARTDNSMGDKTG